MTRMLENGITDALLLLPDEEGQAAVTPGLGMVRAQADTRLCLMAGKAMRQEAREAARSGEESEAAWRGLVAMALLMDTWPDTPNLRILEYNAESSAFARAALRAFERDSLRLLIAGEGDNARVLGVQDADAVLLAPENPEDWSQGLSERVTWYADGRFLDPTARLCQRDRHTLAARLQLLGGGERVAAFRRDLEQADAHRAEEALQGVSRAAWLAGIKAAVALGQEEGFEALKCETLRYLPGDAHPLFKGMDASGAPQEEQRVWYWKGEAVARTNRELGVEPLLGAGLTALQAELETLERYSPRFCASLGQRLTAWLTTAVSLSAQAREALEACVIEAREKGARNAETLSLSWPWSSDSPALRLVLRERLGDACAEAASAPFADCLTLASGASLGDEMETARFTVMVEGEALVAIPPLSASMAAYLSENGFGLEGLMVEAASGRVRAQWLLPGQVMLARAYTEADQLRLASAEVPTVALWPSVPLEKSRWHAYYLSVRGSFTVRALQGGTWQCVQEEKTESDEADAANACHVAATEEMPGCVTLWRQEKCLGALLYTAPVCYPPCLGGAIGALDLGAAGVTLAVSVQENAQLVTMPSLWRGMLRPTQAAEAEERLPVWPLGPVLPSAVRLRDEADEPFLGGEICQTERTGESWDAEDCCYDPLWRADAAAERARRLLVREAMLLCSLHAVMYGAQSIAWRVALPPSMAADGRNRLMAEACEAAEWAARRTGLTQTPGGEPMRLREAMAAGLYLRDSGAVRGAFALLDIGGADACMALWLRGMNRPAAEFQIHLGIFGMLCGALKERPALLKEDFAGADGFEGARLQKEDSAAWQAWSARRAMVDETLGARFGPACAWMNAQFAQGQMTYTQALLLLGFASLLLLTGAALERVRENPLLNDYLPPEMTLCLCGRGSFLLSGMDGALRRQLMGFARMAMRPEHPVRSLRMALSGQAKLETALGLCHVALSTERPDPVLAPGDSQSVLRMAGEFLAQFVLALPQAGRLLFPGFLDESGRVAEEAEEALRHAAYGASGSFEQRFCACVEALRASFAAKGEAS